MDATEIIEGQVKADAGAAAQPDKLAEAIDALAAKLQGIPEQAAEQARAAMAAQPATQPAWTPEQFADTLDAVVEKSGGKIGPAIVEALRQAGPAMLQQQAESAASIKRDLAARDPKLVFPGSNVPLVEKYTKEIDSYIKANNIPANYLAQKGYGEIAELIALKDPAYREALGAQAVERYKAEQAKGAGKPAATAVEGVHVGDVPVGSKPAPSVEAEIASIKVDPLQARLCKDRYRLTENDIRRQKWEIEQQVKKHGEDGIRQMGGVPVCEMEDVPIEAPVPGRAQRKIELREE